MFARVLAGVAEVQGFLALLELQTARIPARTTGAGDPVLILDQDRRLWDRRLTGRGLEAMHRAEQLAAAGSPVGPYMLQAGIAACHARAIRAGDTDGPTRGGPRRARQALRRYAATRLPYLPAVRAHVLEKAGRNDAARESWQQAAQLTRNDRERQLYSQRAHERSEPCQ